MTTTAKPYDISDLTDKDGEFRRKPSTFRNTISKDPNAIFTPEKLVHYIGIIAHPQLTGHRTLIVRSLKGLEDIIGLSVVNYIFGDKGWKFSTPEETPGCIPDTVNNAQYLSELCFKANPDYEGRNKGQNFYPKHLSSEIDKINDWIYNKINDDMNHIGPLFEALDDVEAILSENYFLVGNTFTETDIRLWTTIVR
ncbi:10571_t:CDS:2 [Dentiscutata erythropus]|uniref:10571_t:CDS:1 n=1 Tax=Dentiscutata erythropus TaxID=1348616 RepID=A0A9N9IM38_9GLOM|nr:10571_t:CDS:2 [Dentiscutata erythropus]